MLDHFNLQSPQSIPLALAAAMLVVVAGVWMYRSQLGLLPQPWKWIVPGLRVAAMAVLALALVKPVVVRLRNPWEQGAVVLLVDRSRSMSVVDARRSMAQRIALADALGALPPGTRPIVSQDLRSRAQALPSMVDALAAARSELDYAQLSGRGTDAAEQRLRDATAGFIAAANSLKSDASVRNGTGRFMQACDDLTALFDSAAKRRGDWLTQLRHGVESVVNDSVEFQSAADTELARINPQVRAAANQIGGMSRLAMVNRAIGDPRAGLLNNLPPQTPVLAFEAAPALAPIATSDFTASTAAADGDSSDLSGAIAALRQKLAGQSVQAVVLYSDGRQVGGSAVAPALDQPLFTVGAAGVVRRDISLSGFELPTEMFAGETITARLEISGTGVHDLSADVRVVAHADAQGGATQPADVVQTRHIAISEGKLSLQFPIHATAGGVLSVSASLEHFAPDVTAANVLAQRRVKVVVDKIAVAMIGGSAGWDYQYFRNALQRTSWIACHDEIVRKDASPLRMTPRELLAQQVIVLDDVDPQALKPEQWNAIDQLAGERGGGVIVIAGDDVPPARMELQTQLAELLPWPKLHAPHWQTWQGELPGYRVLPAAGQSSEVLKLSDDPDEDRRRWAQLPPLFRVLPLGSLKAGAHPLLIEEESSDPVLTETRVGVGRALFLGANETWRWRYKQGERDQDRFWLQLIREAAEPPYAFHEATTEAGIVAGRSMDVDSINPTPHQSVHVRARLLDPQGRPIPDQQVFARVESKGKTLMIVPMRGIVAHLDTGRFTCDLPPLAAGHYDIRLIDGQTPTPLLASLDVAPDYEAEMADVSGDEGNLRRLAEASGGAFLPLDQVGSLPQRLSEAREQHPRMMSYSLWDSPYLFLFVLSCLTAEWALRKQFGLV
jgi:hypothetical protein